MSKSNYKYGDKWWRKTEPEHKWKIYEDFRVFLCLVWSHLNLPQPTPIQLDIAYYLQHGNKRCIIQAFRGVGKSWITSAFVCWLLLRNPLLKILVVSASKDRADMFSSFVKRLIAEMPILQHLLPNQDQRSSMISFDVGPATPDHSPSVKSVGIFGQFAGSRADIIIPDDIEVPNNSETQGMRDKLSERVKEFDAVLKPLPSSRVCYLGTPQCEDSLYPHLVERGYEMRIWPCRYPSEKWQTALGIYLAPTLMKAMEEYPALQCMPEFGNVGAPTDPDRFDHFDLEQRELSYGRSGFALQFQLDTSLSDGDRYPLRLADLLVTELDNDQAPEKFIWSGDAKYALEDLPNVGLRGDRYLRPGYVHDGFANYTGSIMFVDPSGRGKDETSIAVVKALNGFLFLTKSKGYLDGYSDVVLKDICTIAKENKVNLILTEKNFGDGMFSSLLRPHLRLIYPCAVEEVSHSKSKEARIIDVLEPVMNQHKLIVDRRVIEEDVQSTQGLPTEKAVRYQLFYQLTRIVREKGALVHDDRLDALAGAVQYWVDLMAQDADDRIEVRKQDMLEKEINVLAGQDSFSLDLLAMGADIDLVLKHSGRSDASDVWMDAQEAE